MYRDHFSFSDLPFSIVPDARYLFMSGRHREALAHLLYGVDSDGGFVLLTGDVGTGKTTVCRCLLENLPAYCDVAFIYNPKLNVVELLATICEEFGIAVNLSQSGTKHLIDEINAYLLEQHAQGRKALLIIDEAQNLSIDVLEQLRLLTNLETNERKLLQIILLGQPELEELLTSKALRQLSQRIVARYHLGPLSLPEVDAYINHRLTVAGSGRKIFSVFAIRRIFQLSKGVPRIVNLLCDRALLGAYVQGKDNVDRRTINRAAGEILGMTYGRGAWRSLMSWSVASVVILSVNVIFAFAYYQDNQPPIAEKYATTTITLSPHYANADPAQNYDRLENIDKVTANQSEGQAMTVLFGLWKLSYRINGGEPFCVQAQQQGLSCLSEKGDLKELRRLDLPAILQLRLEGSTFYAALTGLDEKSATLVLGNNIVKEIPLNLLQENWSGVYTVLWRTPSGYSQPLKLGSREAAVNWLRKRLEKINGLEYKVSDPLKFDDKLVDAVKKFQATEGLPITGIAEPLTLAFITSRNVNTPGLTKVTLGD